MDVVDVAAPPSLFVLLVWLVVELAVDLSLVPELVVSPWVELEVELARDLSLVPELVISPRVELEVELVDSGRAGEVVLVVLELDVYGPVVLEFEQVVTAATVPDTDTSLHTVPLMVISTFDGLVTTCSLSKSRT